MAIDEYAAEDNLNFKQEPVTEFIPEANEPLQFPTEYVAIDEYAAEDHLNFKPEPVTEFITETNDLRKGIACCRK